MSIDIGTIKLVLQHAAAVYGLRVSVEAVDLARYALKRLGVVPDIKVELILDSTFRHIVEERSTRASGLAKAWRRT